MMKIGLMYVNSGPLTKPELFSHLARTAERLGFESVWTVEHVVIPQNYQTPYPYSRDGKIPGGEDVPISDPFLLLAYAAAITTKLRLGTGVIILPQHHPMYVAKEMATLDVLSHGRAMLGVGSGWFKEGFAALGLDFHTRGARTDESIQVIRALWREDPSGFHGAHFGFEPVRSFPKPVQKGGVPIHVGGHSPAAARRAARFGDGFFSSEGDISKLNELFRIMREECARRGRSPAEIELSCMGRAKLDSVRRLADIGISRVIFGTPASDAEEALARDLEKIANEVIAKL